MNRSITLFVSAIALCACSQKEAAKQDSPAAAQAGAAPAASHGGFDPASHTATIHAKDFAFDAPDSIGGGWTTFHLVNDGPNLHHVQIVRLDSSKTAADLDAALKNPSAPPPRWAVFLGGPNAPNPGASSDAMIDMQPGNYVLLCMVDIPGKVPHFAKGMVRPLTVTAASGTPAAEPNADVTVTLSDYKFDATGPMTTAGNHTIKLVNKGPQPHEVEIVRLAPGKTMKDFGDFMAKAYADKVDGPPPGDAIGGITGLIPGATQYFTANLTPGNYAMICFLPDAKDGKPHVDHGLVKEFTVK
jgi:hypothetical protein